MATKFKKKKGTHSHACSLINTHHAEESETAGGYGTDQKVKHILSYETFRQEKKISILKITNSLEEPDGMVCLLQ